MSANSERNNEQPPVDSAPRPSSAVNFAETFPPGGLPETLGDYQIHRRIGAGGMGAVYKATHVRLKRTVALKVLASHLLDDSAALIRFRREIEAVGKLPPHRNVVLATDARQVGDTHFLVMEYVDGLELGELVRRQGPLAIDDACEITRQAAVGLDHIATHGLIHRDLKPTNLLLTSEGVVKILDLGLARFSALDRPTGELTQSGQCLGTPDYMAPEQWENSAEVGIAADLYSLGCTLFFLLAGRVPFGGPSHNTIFKKREAHLRESPPDLKKLRRDTPGKLVEIVNRLLSKKSSQRIVTPRLLAEELRALVAGSDLRALHAAVSSNEPSPSAIAMTETETINSTPTDDDLYSSGSALGQESDKQGWRHHHAGMLAVFSIVTCLIIAVWGAGALRREQPTASSTTQQREAGEETSSKPHVVRDVSLREAQLWVRRGGDDASIRSYPLVTQGRLTSVSELKSLADSDDFNLRAEFSEPIWWRLIWLDTSGRVTIAARAEQPSAVVWYPGPESMMSIDPADPPGQHLLLLVRDDQPKAVDDAEIKRVLSPLIASWAPAPDMLAQNTRGPGQARETLALHKHEYLQSVTDHLPVGSQIELPLFLPANQESK